MEEDPVALLQSSHAAAKPAQVCLSVFLCRRLLPIRAQCVVFIVLIANTQHQTSVLWGFLPQITQQVLFLYKAECVFILCSILPCSFLGSLLAVLTDVR